MRPQMLAVWVALCGAVAVADDRMHLLGQPVLVWCSEAAACAVWPLLCVSLACAPALASGLVPRRWRMWWRRSHDRPSIPKRLRWTVYAADRHRCLYCGFPADLQVDHFRPWSCGGLSSLFNLMTLCGTCNRIKSNYWVWRSGRVTYRPWIDADRITAAAAILACERRARRNPLRWYRIAWALR